MKLNKASLKHQIADQIRKMIFEGKLKPGDKITEVKISNDLGVSRGPIREAIQILVMEGLLVATTFKETKVNTITSEEVAELLIPMRVSIETFALKRAYSTLQRQQFKPFEDIYEQMRRATIFNDVVRFNDLDIQFHEQIVLNCELDNLVIIWGTIANRVHLYFTSMNTASDLDRLTNDHRILLESFKTGDIKRAVDALSEHILDTATLIESVQ